MGLLVGVDFAARPLSRISHFRGREKAGLVGWTMPNGR
jgi:hypothetical protein